MKTLVRSYIIYLVWDGAKLGTILAHWLPSNYAENVAFGIVTQRDASRQREWRKMRDADSQNTKDGRE